MIPNPPFIRLALGLMLIAGPGISLASTQTTIYSDNLSGFTDIPATASGNTLTIAAADADPDNNGRDFYRVRN